MDSTLAFCILINQRERGQAIGIEKDTRDCRGLSAYVRHSQREQAQDAIETIVRATWLRVMIEEMKTLSECVADHIEANIEDEVTRNDGLYTMTKLDSYISHLGDELEAIL